MEHQFTGWSFNACIGHAITCASTYSQQGPGDILVFLTGREDIERCLDELAELLPTQVNLQCFLCG